MSIFASHDQQRQHKVIGCYDDMLTSKYAN